MDATLSPLTNATPSRTSINIAPTFLFQTKLHPPLANSKFGGSAVFAGSLRAGKRAAAVMSLIHSSRLHGLEPYAYIRDVLERLPTQPASRIDELLPHRWRPQASA